jgi:glycogen(starch) synthase
MTLEASESRRVRVSAPSAAGTPRFVYIAGPGDIVVSYRHWKDQSDDPSQLAVTYSGQFYEVCRVLDAESLAVSSHPRGERLDDPPFRVENRPSRYEQRTGLGYHLGEIGRCLRLIASAVAFRADAVVIQGGFTHWYLFGLLRLFGIDVIPVLMVVFWRKYHSPGKVARTALRLNGWFFRHCVARILCASDDIRRQVVEVAGGRPAPIEFFLPMFRAESFPSLGAATTRPPFRILFAGRMEANKGIFDLLKVASLLEAEGRTDIEFDLCGTGTAFDELKNRVDAAHLRARFRLHGHCERTVMTRMYGRAHAVIVPTTSDFVEGFNQVVVEAVLSGKPVVTSAVCPALEYVREAAVEVPPDDVAGYRDAILRLADSPSFYEEKRAACAETRDRLLGSDRVFGLVLESVLSDCVRPRDVAQLGIVK